MKVVIIGAGAAGLGIGWRLLQRGAEVTVVERAQAARGAIWAAAGMIAPVGEDVTGADAEFGRKSSNLWPDFAAELEARSGIEIAYRKSGALLVATDEEHAALLGERTLADEGMELLNGPQTLEKEPMLTPLICGGVWAPDEAQVDNRALGRALTAAFVRDGGNLQRNEAVVRFELAGDKVAAVRTPFRFYHADAFVIAAGAWSTQFEGVPQGILPPVEPVKGEMIALAPPAGARLPHHVIWGNEVYLVPRRELLLAGATVARAGFDTAITEKAAQWLKTRATDLLPALEGWEIDEQWAGLRPGSPDELPILGPTQLGNLFVATGQYRNGILFTPVIAEVMAQTVLEGKLPEACAAFDARRFLE